MLQWVRMVVAAAARVMVVEVVGVAVTSDWILDFNELIQGLKQKIYYAKTINDTAAPTCIASTC